MSERVKELRKKTGMGFLSYPIGSDAEYVDMSSGLDLEEELKFGGNHQAIIKQYDDRTEIQQFYINRDDSNFSEDNIIYKIITSIFNTGNFSKDNLIVTEIGDILAIGDNNILSLIQNIVNEEYITTEIQKYDTTTNPVNIHNLHKKRINFLQSDEEDVQTTTITELEEV